MRDTNEGRQPGDVPGARPVAPDLALMDAARDALAQWTGASLAGWEVLERVDRPRSTVFRVRFSNRESSWDAYYKAEFLPGSAAPAARARWEHVHRQVMLLEDRFAAPLREVLADEGIAVDSPLALDPERLHGVRLEVPGVRLGKTARFAVPTRRTTGKTVFERIGRAMRLIETITASEGVETTPQAWRDDLEQQLATVASSLPAPDLDRIARRIDRLIGALERPPLTLWGHGDVSQANVLVHGGRVGLVDFSWLEQPPGRDLAYFALRVECETPQVPGWSRALIDAALRGYGVDPDDPTPEWCLVRLRWALAALHFEQPRVRAWAKRQLQSVIP